MNPVSLKSATTLPTQFCVFGAPSRTNLLTPPPRHPYDADCPQAGLPGCVFPYSICHKLHAVTDIYCVPPSATSSMLSHWHLLCSAICHKLHAVTDIYCVAPFATSLILSLTFIVSRQTPQAPCCHTDIYYVAPSATSFILSLTFIVSRQLPQAPYCHTDIYYVAPSATSFILSVTFIVSRQLPQASCCHWLLLCRAVCHKLHAASVICIARPFTSHMDMRLPIPGKYFGCSSVAFHLHYDDDKPRKSCSSTYLVEVKEWCSWEAEKSSRLCHWGTLQVSRFYLHSSSHLQSERHVQHSFLLNKFLLMSVFSDQFLLHARFTAAIYEWYLSSKCHKIRSDHPPYRAEW
jgi:hypothetical protein